jgi:peroxiredoxin
VTDTEHRSARELNDEIRYTLWSVFRIARPVRDGDRSALAAEADELLAALADKGVATRGTYDVSGYKGDADLLVWWTGPEADALQGAYNALRRTALGAHLEPVWSSMAVHRPAEFNRSHVPAFAKGEEPGGYICLYPFNRSLEWYLLPDFERRGMLAEHGQMGRDFEDVRANTVPAFGLGDYEWILAFEADELHRIVDCLRHLRGSRARLHTKLETPFFTGPRRPLGQIVSDWP